MAEKLKIETINEKDESMEEVIEISLSGKKEYNRGAWTSEEDQKLAQAIEIYGPKRWKTIANKAGLDRGGKSCRLRWMNYLRPNIKRGDISDQEEDLILRLHKLLGNRWSLIAGRLPGRTDNEIKNHWNSHLSKKAKQKDKEIRIGGLALKDYSKLPQWEVEMRKTEIIINKVEVTQDTPKGSDQQSSTNFNVDDFFDFSNENPFNLEWVSKLLQVD